MSLKDQTQQAYFKLIKYSTPVHSHPHAAQNTVYLNGAQHKNVSRMFNLLSTIQYSVVYGSTITNNATKGKFLSGFDFYFEKCVKNSKI